MCQNKYKQKEEALPIIRVFGEHTLGPWCGIARLPFPCATSGLHLHAALLVNFTFYPQTLTTYIRMLRYIFLRFVFFLGSPASTQNTSTTLILRYGALLVHVEACALPI